MKLLAASLLALLALPASAMQMSAAAFVTLLSMEGYSERAYADPAHGWKVPTVGFVTTGADIKQGTILPPVPAIQRALKDITVFENGVKRSIKVPITQGQFDSFAIHSYNIGVGAFSGSTIVRRTNAGDDRGGCEAILMWKIANGYDCSTPGNKICWGLWQRRLDTRALCLRDLS